MVITNCVHKDKYCGLDLSSVADTGAGELWVELEDALIAQHVFRAFMQWVIYFHKHIIKTVIL